MKSCAFFGHAKGDYQYQQNFIESMAEELIVYYGVTEFYVGMRGAYDFLCARVIYNLKQKYPYLRLIQVLSYIPQKKEYKTPYCDDSVYLLVRNVPKQFAIIETNKLIVDKVDFIITGIEYDWGGAAKAVEYARKKKKEVISFNDKFSEGKVFDDMVEREVNKPLTSDEIVMFQSLHKQV